jgi:ATP-dependent Clp protease ATP-binding subunit ClpA
MDRGTVTDNRGRSLYFANSMVVFTSNLGFSESASRAVPIGYRGDESREIFEQSEVDRSLRQALSAEFVNRLRIIRFSHLTRSSIEKIFDLEFDRVRRRFRDVHGLELDVTTEAREQILSRGYSHEFGARHLGSVINRVANVEVSKRIKRDDEGGERLEREVLDYLRQIRRKERAFDPREVRARVLGTARVRVPYRRLTIGFEDGAFVYRT